MSRINNLFTCIYAAGVKTPIMKINLHFLDFKLDFRLRKAFDNNVVRNNEQ